MSDDIESQIQQALKSYAAEFLAANADTLIQLWDPESATSATYLPAESGTPLQGLAALKAYYDRLVSGYIITKAEATNIHIRRVDGTTAYALCDFIWQYKPRAKPEMVIDFRSRGSIVLQKRDQRWFYLHMHESVTWTEPT
jgi:hypothetical protein